MNPVVELQVADLISKIGRNSGADVRDVNVVANHGYTQSAWLIQLEPGQGNRFNCTPDRTRGRVKCDDEVDSRIIRPKPFASDLPY